MIPPVKEVNDFVRESQKIINKDGSPTSQVSDNNEDHDPGHESVIPELAKYDGSVPIDRSKPNLFDHDDLPAGAFREFPPANDEDLDFFGKAETPDKIANGHRFYTQTF